ncbi:MAG: carbohydrate-binding protein, partial [bacterium]|nr:carbohydrate-binding protein [bacterium]
MKPLLSAIFLSAVLAASAQQAPYGGTPRPVPGTVQAENYDAGGEGVAYHDADAANQGGRHRTGEGVDVEDCGEGGYNVGYVQTGEWLEYTVQVRSAGDYTIRFRAAALSNPGRFSISVNNKSVRSSVTVPVTGNWQVYAWVDVPNVTLTAGTAVLRITALTPDFNLDYFTFVPAGPPPPPLDSLPVSPSFSAPHGFYETPFDLTVWSDSANAVIRYTLDGSDPRTSLKARETSSPAVIRVDPASTDGRGLTPAVVVRAIALSPAGMPVTQTGGQTYIFPEKVRTQSDPRGDWPFYPVNDRRFDYAMDPDVVNDPRYRDRIDDALRSIPILSVATDPGSLFHPDSGIYVNPTGHGIEWERAASIELYDPRGREPGFQINGGLRIRGGWSRQASGSTQQLKLAFRFFFRKEYGKGKLDYPLFQDEGPSSFDGVDLRTSQNYSWSMKDYSGHICTFIRDVFSRDCQRDMGQPYTRTRPYHLFLNGMYWGLYETQERSEASYAETYFGGDKADYDVIKVARQIGLAYEATDGTVDAYQRLWSLTVAGFKTNALYFKALGRNADGSVNWAYPVYVDPVNLIDYMLVIFYTGNFDAPVSAWGGNSSPNNIYCVYNRLGRRGFLYFCHDSEHTLMDPRYSEHSDYGYDRTGPYPGGSRDTFNPQWLHQRLSENAEYRMLFADRVYRHFFNRGALTADASRARFSARAAAIETAVIAESARWGDAKVHPPRTKDEDWQPAVDWILNTYFSDRTEVVLGQIRNDNLYPSIDPPAYSHSGSDILDDGVSLPSGSRIRLRNVNAGGKGTILYTLDGSDPRLIGGAANPAAVNGGDDATVTVPGNCALKSRVLDGTVWSALHELAVNAGEGISGLALTEIHYHPLGEGDVDDREFE